MNVVPVVVAEIVRSGIVEGVHCGRVVALGVDGALEYTRGDVAAPMLPRSCSKPLQALAMVRSGLPLDGHLLALACASHSGEQFHLDGVREILGEAGLDETALQNPKGWPLSERVRDQAVAAGSGPDVLRMNCSGKHAAMLLTCVVNGWPVETYLDPEHPLQVAIAETVADLAGEPIAGSTTDGCGAPLLSVSLVGLARAFRAIATSAEPAAARVASAMRSHPEYLSGTDRDELALARAIPGSLVKFGAEACYAVALADGRSFALKIDDGGDRARPVVMSALLDHLGVTTEPGVDGPAVLRLGRADLYGGSHVVGEIRAVLS